MQAENLDYDYLPLDVILVKPCQVMQNRWKLTMPSQDDRMAPDITNDDRHYRLL
jgi:hypothetical protein